MYISDLDTELLSDQTMSKLLYTNNEDDNQHGDCIFVAGSSKAVEYRLPKAIELYKQGRADKILFSGGVTWNNSELSEAMRLKRQAMLDGVPECDILIEEESLHTLENVLASLLILNREFHLYQMKRILVVTASYHMRRLHLTLKTYMPDWIEFTLCSADDNNTTKNNWFLSEHGRHRVETESKKLISYVKQGILLDAKIG